MRFHHVYYPTLSHRITDNAPSPSLSLSPSLTLRSLEISHCTLPRPVVHHLVMITSLMCLKLIRVHVGREDRVSERTWTLQQLLAGLKGFRDLEELVFERTELFIGEPHVECDAIGTAMREIVAVGSTLRRLRFAEMFLAIEHLHHLSTLHGLEELEFENVRFRPNCIEQQFDFVRGLTGLSKLSLCSSLKSEWEDGYPRHAKCVLESLSAHCSPCLTSLRHLVVDINHCEDVAAVSALTALTHLDLKIRHYTGGKESTLAPLYALTNLRVLALDPVSDPLPVFSGDGNGEVPEYIPLCDSLPLLADLPYFHTLKVVMKGLTNTDASDVSESEDEDEGEEWDECEGVLDLYGVAQLTRLTSLTLGIRMDRHELSPLTALTNLRRLGFQGGTQCRLGCEDFREIAGMGSLEDVDVRECEVVGDGMRWLALLPRLKRLRVRDEFEEAAKEVLLCTALADS